MFFWVHVVVSDDVTASYGARRYRDTIEFTHCHEEGS
jgi:hypothetical protein